MRCFLVNQLRPNHFWCYCFFNNFIAGGIVRILHFMQCDSISRSIGLMGISNTFSMISFFNASHSSFLICTFCGWKCLSYGIVITLGVLVNQLRPNWLWWCQLSNKLFAGVIVWILFFAGRVIPSAGPLDEWVSATPFPWLDFSTLVILHSWSIRFVYESVSIMESQSLSVLSSINWDSTGSDDVNFPFFPGVIVRIILFR